MTNIHISNQSELKSKIKHLRESGMEKLHIITDFDRTLTTRNSDGTITTTSWAIFAQVLPESYVAERKKLFDHYRPIEIDTSLDIKTRATYMKEWWNIHLNLLIKYKLSKDTVSQVAHKANITTRDGVAKFFEFTNKHKIPVLIFSAGIGDVVQVVLQKYIESHNAHIIANHFLYNSKDEVVGFQKEIIHTLNKNEHTIRNESYHQTIQERKSCILFGDTLEDVSMSDGLQHDVIIKIGFLNGDTAQLESFKKVYDIVLEDEKASFDILDSLLNADLIDSPIII
jgi:5'-nucleotidase